MKNETYIEMINVVKYVVISRNCIQPFIHPDQFDLSASIVCLDLLPAIVTTLNTVIFEEEISFGRHLISESEVIDSMLNSVKWICCTILPLENVITL